VGGYTARELSRPMPIGIENYRLSTIFVLSTRLPWYGRSHAMPMNERDSEITAAVVRERAKLWSYIRRRVPDPARRKTSCRTSCSTFVRAYRLPSPSSRPPPGCSASPAIGSSIAPQESLHADDRDAEPVGYR